VNLFILLGVVVDELADVGLCECDLGEDFVGGGGPGEWLGGGVPVGDVVTDQPTLIAPLPRNHGHCGRMARLLARVALAAFVGMIPIVLDAPAAIASPHTPMDCVPVGVTKDSHGVVWAEEDCDGGRIRYRMSPLGKDKR
jgi:hypothetical protein